MDKYTIRKKIDKSKSKLKSGMKFKTMTDLIRFLDIDTKNLPSKTREVVISVINEKIKTKKFARVGLEFVELKEDIVFDAHGSDYFFVNTSLLFIASMLDKEDSEGVVDGIRYTPLKSLDKNNVVGFANKDFLELRDTGYNPTKKIKEKLKGFSLEQEELQSYLDKFKMVYSSKTSEIWHKIEGRLKDEYKIINPVEKKKMFYKNKVVELNGEQSFIILDLEREVMEEMGYRSYYKIIEEGRLQEYYKAVNRRLRISGINSVWTETEYYYRLNVLMKCQKITEKQKKDIKIEQSKKLGESLKKDFARLCRKSKKTSSKSFYDDKYLKVMNILVDTLIL